jgi:hypothetical protein
MRYLLLLLLVSFSSCKTLLTSTHTSNVEGFARSAKTLSTAPGELYRNISDFRHELRLIESSTLFSSDKVIPRLNSIADMRRQFETNAAQINQACMIIHAYAQSLLALVDAGYQEQLENEDENLGLQLSSAISAYNKNFNKQIPAGVGDFLGVVINKIGSVKLRKLQKQYLKEFVVQGDVIVDDVCDYFAVEVAGSLENEMNSLDQQFVNVMGNFYDNIEQYQRNQNINPFDYLKDYNPMYIELRDKLAGLHRLKTMTVSAMKGIQSTHERLKESVMTETPTNLKSDILSLFDTMKEIKSVYDDLGIN